MIEKTVLLNTLEPVSTCLCIRIGHDPSRDLCCSSSGGSSCCCIAGAVVVVTVVDAVVVAVVV